MTDPTDWCYPSGIVAVLETFLLTPRAVGELMGSAPSYGELLSRARRSPVYAAVSASDADDPMHVAAELEATLVDYVRHFVRECPDERIADALLIEYDLRDLANHLKSRYCDAERRSVALSGLPEEGIDEFLAEAPRLARIALAVAEANEAGDSPISAFTIDLMMDGAFIGMLPELTAPLGSPVIDEWAGERQRFTAIEAVVRARMSGAGPSEINDHLVSRLPARFGLAALAEVELDGIRRALLELLPAEIADRFDPSAGAGSIQALAARLDSALARILQPCRYVAFGPERVFAYLCELFRENRNLRAALGGCAGRIEPGLVALSMRGANA